MSLTRAVQRRLTDSNDPRSFSAKARARRWRELTGRFPGLAAMRVLDLGGMPDFWRAAPVRPAEVITVNLLDAATPEPWLAHLVDDACTPSTLGDQRFDLVISNSLLEHVGGYQRRRELAAVIRSRADRHWVQTPYRYFPIEPHWAFPGLQFLPVQLRAELIQRWPLGHAKPATRADAVDDVLGVELLSVTEMRLLFPDSALWHERAAGLTKSLVAVRGGVRPA